METIKKILSLILKKIKREKSLSFFVIFLIAVLILLNFLSDKYLIEIPRKGGEVNEIILVEKPRFINPVLGITNIDKTLISLIYSPLLKKNSNGNLVENIAQYKIDKTGLKYTIKLKNDIYFHDGEKMDIDDVIFTIQQIQNPVNNSFYRPEWINVELIKVDNLTLDIKLSKANYYFKDSLTLSILPKHIWEKIEYFNLDDGNINPIGSGPFKIDSINWKDNEINKKINSIRLSRNENYFKGEIFVENIIFNFFDSKESFLKSSLYKSNKNVNLFSYDFINELGKDYKNTFIHELVDFNLTIKNKNSNPFLNNEKIRKFIFKVWNSKEEEIDSLREIILKDKKFTFDKENNLLKYDDKIISFSTLTGSNQDESLIQISENLKKKMRKAGIDLNLKKVNESQFLSKYRSRDFESIISGYYTEERYWFYYYHSSQKNDPWINIAQINSLKINTLLEDLRKNLKSDERENKIKELKKELDNYSLILNLEKSKSYYYLSKNIDNLNLDKINYGEKRFDNIQNWVLEKEKILPFFKK